MKPPKPGNTNFLLEHSDWETFIDVRRLHGDEMFPLERPEKPCLIYFLTEIPGNFCEWLIISLALSLRGSDNSRVYSQATIGWSEPNEISLFIYVFLTLTSRIDANQRRIGSVTKDSFVSLVTNLKNKNNNCKQ